jgi:hypothetical protein
MKKILAITILLSGLWLFIGQASAQIIDSNVASNFTSQVQPATGYTSTMNVGSIVALLVRAALGLLAIIFLILMIFAGFSWMTAAGDEAKVKKASGTIKTAIIGLLIVLAAYAITYFLFSVLPFSVGSAAKIGGSGT